MKLNKIKTKMGIEGLAYVDGNVIWIMEENKIEMKKIANNPKYYEIIKEVEIEDWKVEHHLKLNNIRIKWERIINEKELASR